MQTTPAPAPVPPRRLRPYQQQGVERLIELTAARHAAILADEPGLGKALANGTGVATPNGFHPIETLQPGDEVFGTDGKPCRVLGVYPQGVRACVQMRFSDGGSITCSEDHLWTVQSRCNRKTGNFRTLTAGEIAADCLDAQGRSRWYVPVAAPVSYGKADHVIPAYTMGALLANGGLSAPTVKLSTGDAEVAERVRRELPGGFSLVQKRRYDFQVLSGGEKYSNIYRRELDWLGLRCRSTEKFIPEEYLLADDRLDLLHGLMDGDGYCSKDGCCQYSTSSPRLAADVASLVESLSGVVRTARKHTGYWKDGVRHSCADSYTLTINFPPETPLFFLERKERRRFQSRKYLPQRLIREAVPVSPQECTCIAVDSPDHLYLTEHYVPTHNTIQVAEYINRTQPRFFLIVCPASLRLNWQHELSLWMKPGAWLCGLEIASYEQVAAGKLSPEICDHLDLVVFDEAHYLKNPAAKRTKACLAIPAKTRLFLTGTPVVNRPMDLYPILSSIGIKLNRTEFGKRYCAGHLVCIRWKPAKKYAWDFTGSSNADELNAALRKHCMIRRTKAEVLPELPAKIRQVIELDIPHGESRKLQDAVNRMFNGMENAAENLADLKRIAFEELAAARLDNARHKLPYVIGYLRDLLEEEKQIVVFAHHREIIDAITEAIPGAVKIYGGMTDHQKDDAVTRFQSGVAPVLAGQTTAAGTGLTLTAAHTVLFAELDWVPGNVIQAEDRCHRIGQTEPVRIIHLVAKDSVDARMVRALVDKQTVIERIVK